MSTKFSIQSKEREPVFTDAEGNGQYELIGFRETITVSRFVRVVAIVETAKFRIADNSPLDITVVQVDDA